ncbi:hypothetical protein ZIOFF_031893 [Zingiber officinale]|uniref:Uncharacterized protein n=1 Tax=Zingiber officinale TaxID=94328 RepID=A0A8J5L0Q1_ZINOF|nr:hypothetical protein ZIOFF_031893 [Zingiber officinale]
MVSAQLWDWSRMEGLEVFNAWRSLSTHPKPHRIPLICSHGLSFEDGGRSPFHGFHSALEVIPGKPGFSLQPPPPSYGNYPTARSNGDSSRRNSTTTEEQKQTRRTNTFYGPLESHWHFPEPEKKKPPLTSKLTFRSL